MTIRNLRFLFRPRSLAIVGSFGVADSVGAVLLRNLRAGGFAGAIMPVTGDPPAAGALTTYASIGKLPAAPDLTVICTAMADVPRLIAEIGERGGKAVLVGSPRRPAASADAERRLRARMLNAARPQLIRILGPASAGLMLPHLGLNASLSHVGVAPGRVAFVSQSATLASAVVDWANARRIGFSCVLHLGNNVDVDLADVLDYLAGDSQTSSIVCHFDAVGNGRKFMSAARAAARNKPVLALRPDGQARQRVPAAAAVYAAALSRAGTLRVASTDNLFEGIEVLARAQPLRGTRLTIIANGTTPARLATDRLMRGGGGLAQLSPQTAATLAASFPVRASAANPIVLAADSPPERYALAIGAALADSASDAVLLIHVPTAFASSSAIAAAVAQTAEGSGRNVLSCWLGGDSVADARRIATAAGVLAYDTPEQAVGVFLGIVQYQRNQELLLQAPPSQATAFVVDLDAARAATAAAVAAGGRRLTGSEAESLLAAYGIGLASASGGDTSAPPSGVRELCLGVAGDAVFGPLILFGQGGLGSATSADLAVALPPLNSVLARELIGRTHVGQSLAGPDRPHEADVEALCLTLMQVSQLITDLEELSELTLDARLTSDSGVLVSHAAVTVTPPGRRRGWRRFAIRPYPKELEERVSWRGSEILLRPIRPDDEIAIGRLVASLDSEDLRHRFFMNLRQLPRAQLARLTHIDYDRQMAFIAVDGQDDAGQTPLGEVRAAINPDNRSAEFAIALRSDLKGRGLGRILTRKIIDYCRGRGIEEICGEIECSNMRMLRLARGVGFALRTLPDESTVEFRLPLQRATPA